MLLAALLVGPFRGAGIAFALTAASAVNTVLLIAFLGKNPHVTVGRALGSALRYTAKLALFSVIAVVPVRLLSPHLLELCAGRGRIIAYGVPLAVNGVVFAALGVMLLFVTGDRQLRNLMRMIKK
jgi:putative peptidoglycan lipid II flippase